MSFRTALFISISFLIGLFSFSALADNHYPFIDEIVIDNAEIFSSKQYSVLQSKLKQLEENTSAQLVIVTINSLKGESIESYALETFNRNKLGQKGIDNGVLILFAYEDRKVRIEVGYGLEGTLTDYISSTIIYDEMIPLFKKKDYFGGINKGTDKIIALLKDPSLVVEYKNAKSNKRPAKGNIIYFAILAIFGIVGGGMLLIFIGLGLWQFFSNYKNLIEAYTGLFTGKISILYFPLIWIPVMLMFFISIMFVGMPLLFGGLFITEFIEFDLLAYMPEDSSVFIPHILIALFLILPIVIAIIKVLTGSKSSFDFSLAKTDRSYVKKNFPSGGGRSSSSSSGGSFSGGGGSSGGGGASGSW